MMIKDFWGWKLRIWRFYRLGFIIRAVSNGRPHHDVLCETTQTMSLNDHWKHSQHCRQALNIMHEIHVRFTLHNFEAAREIRISSDRGRKTTAGDQTPHPHTFPNVSNDHTIHCPKNSVLWTASMFVPRSLLASSSVAQPMKRNGSCSLGEWSTLAHRLATEPSTALRGRYRSGKEARRTTKP